MKTVHIGRLQKAAASRKPGYLEAHIKVGKNITLFGQPFVQMTDVDYFAIKKEFALAKPVVSAPAAQAAVTPKPSEGGPKKMPGPLQLARNALGATACVITAAAKSQPIQATEEVFKARMAICADCEFFDKSSVRCSQCGCFLAAQVIGRARLAAMECPTGKWPSPAASTQSTASTKSTTL